jgi:ribosome biogenesis GTPase
MDLLQLGWNEFFVASFQEFASKGLAPARVIEQMRGLYRIRTQSGEFLAEISGRIRGLARNHGELPAVGDWVVITSNAEVERVRIEGILPRRTQLSRKAAGRTLREQVIAANLDTVFVVTSANQEFNTRRMARYISAVWDSGARPMVLLNKIDLCDRDPRVTTGPTCEVIMAEIESAVPGVDVLAVSALGGNGMEILLDHIPAGSTAALVGSSGVGKSTIIGVLAKTQLRTRTVRDHDDRGRHTTTSRQMIFLRNGGMVIDTPGMREFQPWHAEEGTDHAFRDIAEFAEGCRFRDCRHGGEPGCAVEQAVEAGLLSRERLHNHHKIQAELRFQERKVSSQAAWEQKRMWKRIHKAMRKLPEG